MRWEDERYVRVYTRDTGDWMALSFEAQALFLMLLRKVDRIGELHLGRSGAAAVGAMVGHPGKDLSGPLGELLADGCVRTTGDAQRLFIPNFLVAQEVAKSPAERKREQRQRDAAQILERTHVSRDVTEVTNGHEMSRSAVPNHAVPSRAEPICEKPADAGLFGMQAPDSLNQLAKDRRKKPQAEKPTDPRHHPLKLRLIAVFAELRAGAKYDFGGHDAKKLSVLLAKGTDEEIEARWRRGLGGQFKERCDTLADLEARWNALTGSPAPPGKVQDIRKSPVRAEDVNQESFREVGRVEL